jgi:hypothetical protein
VNVTNRENMRYPRRDVHLRRIEDWIFFFVFSFLPVVVVVVVRIYGRPKNRTPRSMFHRSAPTHRSNHVPAPNNCPTRCTQRASYAYGVTCLGIVSVAYANTRATVKRYQYCFRVAHVVSREIRFQLVSDVFTPVER